MKKFLFLIPRTPVNLRTPLRERLWELSLKSLKSQRSQNWQALILGEEEQEDGPFIYLKTKAGTKGAKLAEACRWLENKSDKPAYLIRFDDDDLFNPEFLHGIEHENFDCYADHYQAHLDLITGKSCLNDYPWMANTIVQKTGHALTLMRQNEMPLITGDHSKLFHTYYKGLNVKWTSKLSPLYIRIVSPTCLSLENLGGRQDENRPVYDFESYRKYKKTIAAWKRFLFWRKRVFRDYGKLQQELRHISVEYFRN